MSEAKTKSVIKIDSGNILSGSIVYPIIVNMIDTNKSIRKYGICFFIMTKLLLPASFFC